MIATNPIGPSPSSETKSIVAENLAFPPDKVDAFAVNLDQTTKTKIVLDITTPSNDGGQPILSYNLYWRNQGESDFKLLVN